MTALIATAPHTGHVLPRGRRSRLPTQLRRGSQPAWSPASTPVAERAVDYAATDAATRPMHRTERVQLDVGLEAACDPEVAHVPTDIAELPELDAHLHTLTLGMLDAMSGLRPVSQITRYFAPAITSRIARQHATAQRRGVRPLHAARVLKVHTCQVTPTIVEASIVVSHAGRVRAIAMRVVGVDARWIVTALEMA